MNIITGFHAIEECLRVLQCRHGSSRYDADAGEYGRAGMGNKTGAGGSKDAAEMQGVQGQAAFLKILYAKKGPRVKSILSLAAGCGVTVEHAAMEDLDVLVRQLPAYLQEHRGIVLVDSRSGDRRQGAASGDALLAKIAAMEKAFAVVLDCVTDPHNVGAILRSADQFGVDAVILPRRHTPADEGVLRKASAGASAWVPVIRAANTVQIVETLKKSGFWIFGADAGGEPLPEIRFPPKTVLIMGSEGNGIGKLLSKNCDGFVSIPSKGNIDSLNVSVAAGILMYEIAQRSG